MIIMHNNIIIVKAHPCCAGNILSMPLNFGPIYITPFQLLIDVFLGENPSWLDIASLYNDNY